jgi:Leucine-rich repeat (LRR) protein
MKKINFFWILSALLLFGSNAKAQVLPSDSLALVDIYNAAGGPTWTNQMNWLTGPVSSWGGVTVSANRVTNLGLQGNNMSGTLSPSIGQLTELTQLVFNGLESPLTIIDIHGTIPAQLWKCTKLTKLQIKYTRISGPIPAGIEALTALSEINFQQTPLKCEIPAEIFNLPSLTKAYLHQSGFIGKVPASLSNATKLNRLYLHGNKLSAGLPFVALPASNAAKVELAGNQFTFADLKPYFDTKSNLAALSCDYQLAKDTIRKIATAGEKFQLDGTVADGEAYAWFKNAETTPVATDPATEVTISTPADNGVYKCIAQSNFAPGCNLLSVYDLRLPSLETDSLALVDLYYNAGGPKWTDQMNWIKGPIGTWGGVTITNGRVTNLGLQGNNMAGTLTPSIGRLTELNQLVFNGLETPLTIIDIHGTIPAELWNCTKLTKLQIKYTKISGPLPAGIEKLQALGEINFQQTPLKCEIPAQLFNLPNLTKAYLHQSGFIGKVPSTLVNAKKLNRLYLHGNHLDAGIPFVQLPASNSAKVELAGNYFTFADVKPYFDYKTNFAGFNCDFQYAKDTVRAAANIDGAYYMFGEVPGGEDYAWFKDAATTPFSVDPIVQAEVKSIADEGVYVCKTQSTMAPGCMIYTPYRLKVASLQTDSLALVDIYNAAGGPNWSNQGNWLTGPLTSWNGVSFNNNRVSGIGLQGNNMAGTISTSVGQLTELTNFIMNGWESPLTFVDIHGKIPAELWNCTKLTKIQIKFTNVTGPIPMGIELLTSLDEINFQLSPMNCEIPKEIFDLPKLTKAYLHQSGFIGSVPSTVVNAKKLTRLYLHDNHLSAGLPFVNLSGLSAKVNLTGNYFTFADVKPYFDIKSGLSSLLCDYQYAKDTVRLTVNSGSTTTLNGEVANGEAYAWFKNSDTQPVGTDATYNVTMNNVSDGGVFTCKAQSSMAGTCTVLTVYKLSLATGLKQAMTNVNVYPNPVMETLNINTADEIRNIRIVDLAGKVLINQNSRNSGNAELTVGNLAKGVYMLLVRTDKGTDVHKIVKE